VTPNVIDASELCGKTVARLCVAGHEPSGEIHAVWLETGPAAGFAIRGAPDGWSLLVDTTPPVGLDLGQYGRVTLTEASAELMPTSAVVRRVSALLSPESDRPFGLQIQFGTGHAVVVYNWGDDIKLESEVAAVVGAVAYQPLCGGP